MNDRIASSIKEKNLEHPVGSAIVKEMYDADNNPAGWAVMVKTAEKSDGGKGWFWYEVTSSTDASQVVTSGNAVSGCVGCHQIASLDMVRTAFPLK